LTEQSREDFRTILPGTGKPDPGILPELAPLIPVHLLPRAIQVALGIQYPELSLRKRTIENLAGRLTPGDDALLEETLEAARATFITTDEIEPALLRTLAPLLPPHLIPQALEMAIHIVEHDTRIEVLVTLATGLSPADQEAILDTALDAIQSLEDEATRASALMMVIRHLPKSLAEKAITLARSFSDKELAAQALAALGKSLNGKNQEACFTEAIELIRSTRNNQVRAWAFVNAASILSKEQIAEALGMARRIRDS
jgi:hypothetical protein